MIDLTCLSIFPTALPSPLSLSHPSLKRTLLLTETACIYALFVLKGKKRSIFVSLLTLIFPSFFFFSTRTYRMNHEPSLSDWTSVLCAVNTFTCSPCQLAQQALTSPLSRLHHRYHTGRRAQRTHTSRHGKGKSEGASNEVDRSRILVARYRIE